MSKHSKKSLIERSCIAHAKADKYSESLKFNDSLAAHRLYIEAENLSTWAKHGFLPNPENMWTPDDNPDYSKPELAS